MIGVRSPGRHLKTAALGLLFLSAAVLGPNSASLAQGSSERAVPESRVQINLSFAPVVKKVAPAVVNVFTSRVVELRRAPMLFQDPMFKRFFGDLMPMPPQQRRRIQNSLGSGVIVDPAGLVVTNHHVIQGSDQIKVVLSDRRELPAEVVLAEQKTDLAVLRVDAGDEVLPSVRLRDSDEIEVGDLVLAIGNPFGLGQTVTSGIVSAKARTQTNITDIGLFLQTDAAINPGNSGGALVDINGDLVGINTAIFSRSGGSQGIGFAIPSNLVRTVIAGAMQGGKLVRPWLGATGTTVSADMAASLDLPRPVGMIVEIVVPGSPAAEAGLRRGDVIVAIDGREVADAEAIEFRIATLAVGSSVPVDVVRSGAQVRLSLTVAPPPDDPPRNLTLIEGTSPFAGATVGNLSPAFASELGLPPTARGVIVLKVIRRSPAARFLRRGDVIVEVNGTKVDLVGTLQNVAARRAGRWLLRVRRGGREISVVINA